MEDINESAKLSRYTLGLWRRRSYIWYVATSELRSQQIDTVLGNLWHLLNPALSIAIYYLIFGLLLQTTRGVDNFILFLTIGLFVFQFTQRSTISGATSIGKNLGLDALDQVSPSSAPADFNADRDAQRAPDVRARLRRCAPHRPGTDLAVGALPRRDRVPGPAQPGCGVDRRPPHHAFRGHDPGAAVRVPAALLCVRRDLQRRRVRHRSVGLVVHRQSALLLHLDHAVGESWEETSARRSSCRQRCGRQCCPLVDSCGSAQQKNGTAVSDSAPPTRLPRNGAAGPLSVSVRGLDIKYKVYEDQALGMRQLVTRGFRSRRSTRVHAIDHLDLDIGVHEAVGIVGSNGSGKSTLLRAIAGLQSPTAGQVLVRGEPHLLGVGAALMPNLSGFRNVILGGLAMGMARDEVEDALDGVREFSGLGEAMGRPMKTYSSGMRARLAFSIATLRIPDVLLIDEALAVGDKDFRERSLARINEIRANASTVIMVTHNLNEIRATCQRAVWLEKGRLVADGATDEILAAYEQKN